MREDPESNAPSGDVGDELRALGENLIEALRAAWDSEERRKLQQEIESGLADLGSSLNKAAAEFNESPTGKRLKGDIEELRHRVRSGEVESKVRDELLQVLRTVNEELEKTASRKEYPGSSSHESGAAEGE